ncbi:hypothetical protein CYV15_05250 [Riemerella anatipestifer]|uniref:hypothetical protein n=1 Tax=Riemerella anatipestifer TaxID=34085 RepID=UPI000D1429EA|nr:hypothetical protein [Riemerella anatipestifer]MDD1524987.1 hypothetical protein [Riemerella anatipestifer]PST44508.1 hypothetical protein CYV15_05250 [Riemerella anatipestifer]
MEALVEIILGGIVTNFLGVHTRYYFFKIFNKNLKKEDFKGEKSEDEINNLRQGVYNRFIGLLVFCILSVGIVYITYKLNLL